MNTRFALLLVSLSLSAVGCGGSPYEGTGASPVAGAEARFEVER